MNATVDVTDLVIETPRLRLRAFRKDDLADFYAYASVPGVGECAGWPAHESIDASEWVLNGFLAEKKVLAIEHKESGRVIGSFGIEPYNEKMTEFENYRGRELGYVLAKDFWGQGLMTEAAHAVIDRLFQKEDYDFLLCGHFDFNERSARVQEKCGFVPYRRLTFDTVMGTHEPGILNLLVNPEKTVTLRVTHPETLIFAPLTKSADELFAAYREATGAPDAPFEAWQFGADANHLAGLVVKGQKRATASAYPVYEALGEPLPKAGELSVVLNSRDRAVCVIETTRVTKKPFSEVDAAFAAREGEGDGSLAYWQKVHREFFSSEMHSVALEFDETMPVVLEEFELRYTLSGEVTLGKGGISLS